MGQTLEQVRNNNLTSIYGRIFAKTKTSSNLTSNGAAGFDGEFIGGPKDIIKAIQDLTTASSAAIIPNYGISRVITSGSSQGPVQYALEAPQAGVEKVLVLDSSSTGSFQFLTTPNGAQIRNTTAGTTSGVVNLLGTGFARLLGITSTLWAVVGFTPYGSSAGVNAVSFSTST